MFTLCEFQGAGNPQPAIARANLEVTRAASLRWLPNPILQLVPGFIGSAR